MIVTQKCADFIIKGRMTGVQPSGMMVQYERQGGSKIPCRVFKMSDIYNTLSYEPECYGKLDGIRRRLTTGFTVLIEKA